jgi:hypothetical protein
MATVNLGAIKFNWKGAYNNSTAYAVDDVVSSGGSSYICILASTGNAVSNGTYWNQMSAAGTNGTNGTDVGTVITTQGDILYRDGSGLQRLPKGTANQELRINSGATAPEWFTPAAAGKLLQVVQGESTSSQSISTGSSFTDITNLNAAITPSATSSKIFIMVSVHGDQQTGDRGFGIQLVRSISGGSSTNIYTDHGVKAFYHGTGRMQGKYPHFELDSPNTTSAITYKVQAKTDGNNACVFNDQAISSITLMEIGV